MRTRPWLLNFDRETRPHSREGQNHLEQPHELTHLLISIQEGSGTRDPHEDRNQWKFQENNRHTQRLRTRWKACEANMIQRLALRERRGVKNALNPEHLGEGKGQRSKCHRDDPVENDDWFTQSNHIVLYAARPSTRV